MGGQAKVRRVDVTLARGPSTQECVSNTYTGHGGGVGRFSASLVGQNQREPGTSPVYQQTCTSSLNKPLPPKDEERTCAFEDSVQGGGQRQVLEPRLLTAGRFLQKVAA